MVTTKDTVRRVLEKLPDDCSMDEFLDQLFYVNLIEKRLDDAEKPGAKTYTTEQVREVIAVWRTSDGSRVGGTSPRAIPTMRCC